MAFISRDKYPYLYWGLRVALPYNLIGIAFGLMLRFDKFPTFWGEKLSNYMIFLFMPVSGPISVYQGNSFGEHLGLFGTYRVIFFFSWIVSAPLIGMLRNMLGFKD